MLDFLPEDLKLSLPNVYLKLSPIERNVIIRSDVWVKLTPLISVRNTFLSLNGSIILIPREPLLFKVFNLQGELVFQSTDAAELRCSSIDGGWDGTYLRTNKKLSSGIYSYNLFFQEIEGWKHNKYGTISLIR